MNKLLLYFSALYFGANIGKTIASDSFTYYLMISN